MRRRAKYLGLNRRPDPIEVPSDRTEQEDARRNMREWLRDRDEDDVPEWDDAELSY